MALPGDVTTFDLTFGPYTDAQGLEALVSKGGKLFPVNPATGKRINVTHVATGQVLLPIPLEVVIDSDGTGLAEGLPHTDNPGLSTVGFAYRVEWNLTSGPRTASPGNKTFAVPAAAGATVDFDLLAVAAAVPGVLVPMGVAAGVADAAVSALLPGPSLTQAAFDSRYATNTALTTGLAAKVNSSTYTTGLAGKVDVMPAALGKWQVALGKRRTIAANVLVADNSLGEGTGASTYANRMQRVLQDSLRARLQPPGVAGAANPYVTRSVVSPAMPGLPYTESGTVGPWSQGLGIRGWVINPSASVTLPFTGTRAKVDYTKASAAGILGVQLDGGAVTLIDTFSASQTYGQWDSGALSAGAHTLVLTRDATSATGRNTYVDGVQLYNGDEAAGVRVWDASKHGITAQTYATGASINDLSKATWAVAVIGFGENDMARTPTEFRTDLEAIITGFRSKGLASSVLLVHRPLPGGYVSADWAAFGAAKAAIAAADTDVAYLDLSATMPAYDTGGNTLGIYSDNKHFNDAGQSWMADLIAAKLLPR